ncbi:MAG: hypothetical protein U9O98_00745, partial [Asgard group archaeon]|nr:hypothetical protein [Asgard group archaeon]
RSQALLDGSNGWSALDTQLRSTGATISTNRVLEKDVPMDGIAYRTNDKAGSFIQIDAVVRKEVTKESILKAFEQSKYKDSIDYPKVSNPPSSYVLGNHNMVLLLPEKISIIGKKRAIVRGLYDNETGYAYHFLTLIKHVISLLEE